MNRITIWTMPVILAGIVFNAGGASAPDGETAGTREKTSAAESKRETAERLAAAADHFIATKYGTAETIRETLIHEDSIKAARADVNTRYSRLTDEDFQLVADELGIEVAAMKAVVSIEAGSAMEGFWAPGVPIINFDPSVYRQVASRAPSKAGDKNARVPEGLTGYARQEWTQLTNARKTNRQGADMGTFWGMFQIGGFNYKICGCESVQEFVDKMSYSELSQLELFAKFIEATGMVKYLKDKDWAKFARAYNGASYAKRGYHTKMAKAYAKFSGKK